VARFVADLTDTHRRELIRGMNRRHGWRIMALGIMPGLVRPFMKAHPSGSPSRPASQFKDFTACQPYGPGYMSRPQLARR
jgi:hypothetical protein